MVEPECHVKQFAAFAYEVIPGNLREYAAFFEFLKSLFEVGHFSTLAGVILEPVTIAFDRP
jgi:hypothetical protein